MIRCEVRRLATVAYENGLAMQERLAERRKRDEIPDQLLLLDHPSIITKGKSGDPAHILASEERLRSAGIRYYDTSRGGDVTWHGPGQLVGYPVIHLGEGRRDVRKYVERLEEVLVRTLAHFGIEAEGNAENRGVWAGEEKIAALGVRMSRWVTSHGFALNIDPDFTGFEMITPCGIPDRGVTSIARLTGRAPDQREVEDTIIREFGRVFERDVVELTEDLQIVKIVVTFGREILLLHRTPDRAEFWQPVTGRVEPGESIRDAARRELAEETGVTGIEPSRLDLVQSFVIDPEYLGSEEIVFVREHLFHVALDEKPAVIVESEEHQGHGWFTIAQALEKIRWPDDREAIEAVQRALELR